MRDETVETTEVGRWAIVLHGAVPSIQHYYLLLLLNHPLVNSPCNKNTSNYKAGVINQIIQAKDLNGGLVYQYKILKGTYPSC